MIALSGQAQYTTENMMPNPSKSFVLPDGRQLEQLGDQTFKLRTLNGEHEAYMRSEEITYCDTLAGQHKATNK